MCGAFCHHVESVASWVARFAVEPGGVLADALRSAGGAIVTVARHVVLLSARVFFESRPGIEPGLLSLRLAAYE